MKNLSGLMKQAQQMQAKMQERQSKLEGMEIEGEAGAGLVSVMLNGKGDLRRVKIDPKVIDPADAEMLEDLIIAAVDHGGSGSDDMLTETVTLNFARVKFEYVPQKKDGSGDASIPMGWDVAANKEH